MKKNEDLGLIWIIIFLVLGMLFSLHGCVTLPLTPDENKQLEREKQQQQEQRNEPQYNIPKHNELTR